MKKKLIVLLIVLAVGLFFVSGFFLGGYGKERTRFVTMSKVYSESSYYKKFQKDLKELEKNSNSQLAEIQRDIREYKASGAEASFVKELDEELLRKQEELTRQYQQKTKEFDEIIWGEINRSISEYGKKHEIDFILGARGDGNIMFGSDRCDITDDVIRFINKKS